MNENENMDKAAQAIEKLKASKSILVNVEDIAPIIDCHPQSIRMQAKDAPQLLGFRVIVHGSRVRIPRLPFLDFLGLLN